MQAVSNDIENINNLISFTQDQANLRKDLGGV
jgi:hypothetical protein